MPSMMVPVLSQGSAVSGIHIHMILCGHLLDVFMDIYHFIQGGSDTQVLRLIFPHLAYSLSTAFWEGAPR